ncbi:MAG: YaaL family protein [Peptococcaceae bacterium]|nr:YaaL family protein [Peptococcaceae bacterium]
MPNNFFVNMINTLGNGIGGASMSDDEKSTADMLALIDNAHKEWLAAQQYFDHVSELDLIDHAVYVSQAAEKRYMYLLKQARSQGLNSSACLLTPANKL